MRIRDNKEYDFVTVTAVEKCPHCGRKPGEGYCDWIECNGATVVTSIADLKKQARTMYRVAGITFCQALEALAHREGYRTWAALIHYRRE